jgi:hypothetical protein
MKCKFKKESDERFCHLIWGECQFIKSGYGEACPIYNMPEIFLSALVNNNDKSDEKETEII